MASSSDWRRALGFSDRLDSTVKMLATTSFLFHVTYFSVLNQYVTARIRHENADLDAKTAQAQARQLEKELYDTSESLQAYHRACEAHSQLPSSSYTEPVFDENLQLRSSISIGPYSKAYHCYDGILSTIYRARRLTSASEQSAAHSTSEWVALKVTTPSTMTAPHDSRREARILTSHKHETIISLLDAFAPTTSQLVLVFPFLPLSLAHLLSQKSLSTPSNIQTSLHALFSALSFLHAHGIIHRDIKPSNILLATPSGPTYLADFGIAWSPLEAETAAEPADGKITDVGTTCYRPPELLFGCRSYGPSLDMWAAGCVVAEAVNLADAAKGALGSAPARSLFEAGDLGSELALIRSIFETLGTPTLNEWPEAASFPDWGKVEFKVFPRKPWTEVLPFASAVARDLVDTLVRFESGDRCTAQETLKHSYFKEI